MNVEYRTVSEKAEKVADGILGFIASTTSVDRYNTIIRQDWNDAAFLANPVFLWMHQRGMPAIGQVVNWTPEEDRTTAEVMFAPTAMGREQFVLYDGGYQRATSVSFFPGDETLVKDSGVLIYSNNEMLELSGVTVPGNAEALKLARSNGLTEYVDGMCRAWLNLKERDDVELAVVGASVDQIGTLRAMYDSQQKRIEELEKLLLARSSVVQPAQIIRVTYGENHE